MTKIEKVARSLCAAVGEPETEWPEWISSAEAAISAIDETDADGAMAGTGSLDAGLSADSTTPTGLDHQAPMKGANTMTKEQEAAVALAKSMLADAEQYRFSNAPIQLAQLRTLISIADQMAADAPSNEREIEAISS